MSGAPEAAIELLKRKIENIEHTIIRMQVEAEFRSEDYLRQLVQSLIDKSIKEHEKGLGHRSEDQLRQIVQSMIDKSIHEYDANAEHNNRASTSLRISVISVSVTLFMFLLTLIGLATGLPHLRK